MGLHSEIQDSLGYLVRPRLHNATLPTKAVTASMYSLNHCEEPTNRQKCTHSQVDKDSMADILHVLTASDLRAHPAPLI